MIEHHGADNELVAVLFDTVKESCCSYRSKFGGLVYIFFSEIIGTLGMSRKMDRKTQRISDVDAHLSFCWKLF